jgi:hypothetical protein
MIQEFLAWGRRFEERDLRFEENFRRLLVVPPQALGQ